jgi:hypothetical protein
MAESKRPKRWRPWLRAFHRDIGYACVGLTIIYALSGLAVNHIEDWDPNFNQYERTHELAAALPDEDKAAATQVLAQLGINEAPTDVFRYENELEIILENRELFVDADAGTILDRGRKPRLLLRIANWLHLNRGKKAWTFVADSYAVFLLFLATSGMLMLPGKKGMKGRGIVFVAIGVLVPVLYVTLSGGP